MPIVLMAFVDTATLCLKLCVFNINDAYVRKLVFLSLAINLIEGSEIQNQTDYESNLYEKKLIT